MVAICRVNWAISKGFIGLFLLLKREIEDSFATFFGKMPCLRNSALAVAKSTASILPLLRLPLLSLPCQLNVTGFFCFAAMRQAIPIRF